MNGQVRRQVAVVAPAHLHGLARAMTEDVIDLLSEMTAVQVAVVAPPAAVPAVRELVWPGTPVLAAPPDTDVGELVRLVSTHTGAAEVALVAGDAPDLPALLVGKLFSALTSAAVAACPADGGGLVALAVGAQVPEWLQALATTLDAPDALAALRAAAPRRSLQLVSGWHRIRSADDVARLDPGLEGWAATRAALGS